MQTCPFCGSVIEEKEHAYYCSFCDMGLVASQIQQNGFRKKVFYEVPVFLEAAKLSTRDLLEKDSYFLTCLLREVRQERSRSYQYYLRFFKKANEEQGDFLDDAKHAGGQYEYWTRKAWILENILRERFGSFPERISDAYLQTMARNIDKFNEKPMRIMS
ncbi:MULTISPECIES: hypothetical protein [Paenibacillus]|nr:hypothetical protein [Paenibacillus rhizosphaerae]